MYAHYTTRFLISEANSSIKILYGLPMAPGSVPRLAAVTKALGTDSISFLIDHPAQLGCFSSFVSQSGVKPLAWIKINMGGNRAGVFNDSQDFLDLADAALEAHSKGALILTGFYSHAGHSYGGDSRAAALKMMDAELRATFAGAEKVTSLAKKKNVTGLPTLVVSAGASPTALSVQNLLSEGSDSEPELKAEATTLSSLFSEIKSAGHAVEIHAGVYPLLDLQQLAAHSLSKSHLSWADIAMTVLAEVHSYYPNRGPNSTDEALVGAGGLALAREFCKAYDGMAILTPWNRKGAELPTEDVETYTGWMVGRFAQEHGILTWGSGKGVAGGQGAGKEKQDVVEVGQKVRLWPNHACITSSHFGWYFVVDEDGEGKGEVVVDVWVKARGW